MLASNPGDPAHDPNVLSIGWGRVSDQNGMNTAFKLLGLPLRYDRDARGGGPDVELERAEREGADAARAAATWTCDGNTYPAHTRRVLAMLEGGDDVDEYLPRRPDLAGEYADDRTPQSLAADIVGSSARLYALHGYNAPDLIPAERVDAIADAYEQGVADTFTDACAAELRRAAR
jgi:hypothetical protein